MVTEEAQYRQLFREMQEEHYEKYKEIFTDGLKSTEGVGAAVVCGKKKYLQKHPREASIYMAEITAIEMTMKIVQEEDGQYFVIYSDSHSVVQSMEDRKTKHPLIRKLQHEIHEAKQKSKNVKICWVPGHSGIGGNKTADREARKASGGGNVIVAIPYTDMFAIIREKVGEAVAQ